MDKHAAAKGSQALYRQVRSPLVDFNTPAALGSKGATVFKLRLHG